MKSKAMAAARAAALALLLAPVAMAGNGGSDAGIDPQGVWKRFLETADPEATFNAYDVLSQIGQGPDGVDPAACRAHVTALREAVDRVPVSLALRRARMLCAEASGDEADADRQLQAIAALSRMALANASESENGRPIPIVHREDAYALLAVAGLEPRYEYFESARIGRYFPLVIAAWDPERNVERHFRFDQADVIAGILREPGGRFPFHRVAAMQGAIKTAAADNDASAMDVVAVAEAFAGTGFTARLARLRQAAEAGGLLAARSWLELCGLKDAPAHCGDGFVDAVLPLAEQHMALPMALLAYAYAEGVGVKPDARAAETLLAASDARWANRGGTLEYARAWRLSHPVPATLPTGLRTRLERAVTEGNPGAYRYLFQDRWIREPGQMLKPLADTDRGYFSSPAQNGSGQGYTLLATLAELRGEGKEKESWELKAAEAGDPKSQSAVGYRMIKGKGVPVDQVGGRRWMVLAAEGGHAWSGLWLAYRSKQDGDYTAAEKWLLGPAITSDRQAILELASLYERSIPGLGGDAKAAADIYRALAAGGDAAARRRLASMALAGRGMDKDTAQARAWLLQDADKADRESQAQLGLAYLHGDFGAVNEKDGVRWVERAIAAGQKGVAVDYGYWLYYAKGTAEGRRAGMAAWRKAWDAGDRSVANNLAWALCVSPYDGEFDPPSALPLVAAMGSDSDELSIAQLDTAAACQAANGHFSKAIDLQKLAIGRLERARAAAQADGGTAAEQAEREENSRNYAQRLALYVAGVPYREAPAAR